MYSVYMKSKSAYFKYVTTISKIPREARRMFPLGGPEQRS